MSELTFQNLPQQKEVYAFEIDDVLYEKKDYILQIYYLFANFVEFTESRPLAQGLLEFMKSTYESSGEEAVIDKTIAKFDLASSYKENFERLYSNAQLPLKLILIDSTKKMLKELISLNKKICILTKGNPVTQLNKLKHLDWEGLDRNVKVYFVDELAFRNIDAFNYIAQDYQVLPIEVEWIKTKMI
ncbi:HAD family hydrolase [Sphingobacterium hungaricum]